MKRIPVISTQIEAIGYDPITYEMDIEFKSHKPDKPPSVYRYRKVTQQVHDALINADSIDIHFGVEIMPYPARFPYRKLSQEEAR